MRSVFLAAALSLAALPAMGQWVYLGATKDGNTRVYGNTDGRTQSKAWFELRDNNPKAESFGLTQSFKSLEEISCHENKIRTLRITAYDPQGKSLGSVTPDGGWKRITPNTTEGVMRAFICKRQPQ